MVTVESSVRESSLGRCSLRRRAYCTADDSVEQWQGPPHRSGVRGHRPERVCLGRLRISNGVVPVTSNRRGVSVRALRITPRMAKGTRQMCDQGTRGGDGSSSRKIFGRNYVLEVMTMAIDVSRVELDLRQKHKTLLKCQARGPTCSTSCRTARHGEDLLSGAGSLAIGQQEARANRSSGHGVEVAKWNRGSRLPGAAPKAHWVDELRRVTASE